MTKEEDTTEKSTDGKTNIDMNSEMSKNDYSLPKLGKDNYVVWKWQFISILEAKDLEDVLTNCAAPQDKMKKAKMILGSALEPETTLMVLNCKTFETRETLQRCFENKTAYEATALFQKLQQFKIKKAAEITSGIGEIMSLVSQLKNMNEEVSETNVMGCILSALPKSYEIFKQIWKATPSQDRSVNNLIARVTAEANELASKEEQSEAKALNAKQKKTKQNKERQSSQPQTSSSNNKQENNKNACRFCKEEGHWIKECPKLKGKFDPEYGKKLKAKKEQEKKQLMDKSNEDDKDEKPFAFMIKYNQSLMSKES